LTSINRSFLRQNIRKNPQPLEAAIRVIRVPIFTMDDLKQDLWEYARRAVEQKDLETAEALGFERCNQCEEWFHRQDDDMVDCAGCGWYCPDCAEDVAWDWCDRCGLVYCEGCAGGWNNPFTCTLCGPDDLDSD
jgi:hypothetical protein